MSDPLATHPFFFFFVFIPKVELSVASGLTQRIIVISFSSFDKASLDTSSSIGPNFARGIPHLLFKPMTGSNNR